MKPNLLAFVVLALLMPPALLHAESGLSYVISLRNESGQLALNSLTLAAGDAPDHAFQPPDGYRLSIVAESGQELYSLNFSPYSQVYPAAPLDYFDENGTQVKFGDGARGPSLDYAPPLLVVPYFRQAKAIRIFDNRQILVLSADVSRYSSIDAQAFRREVALAQLEQPDGRRRSPSNAWLAVAALSLIALLALAYWHMPKKDRKEKQN